MLQEVLAKTVRSSKALHGLCNISYSPLSLLIVPGLCPSLRWGPAAHDPKRHGISAALRLHDSAAGVTNLKVQHVDVQTRRHHIFADPQKLQRVVAFELRSASKSDARHLRIQSILLTGNEMRRTGSSIRRRSKM